MVFPIQRPPNFHPNQMQRMPNNAMFPNRGFYGPPKGNAIQNMIQRFLPTQGMQQGALPATRAVGGGLSGTLNNVQQVLKVVQSTAPIVQQYGPMVKNLPKMYQLMKALKEDDDEETTDEETTDEETTIDTESTTESTVNESINSKIESTNVEIEEKASKSKQGLSKPKLYI